MMMLFFLLSCTGPTLKERWDESPRLLVEQSHSLDSFEQQLLFRWVRDQQHALLQEFCAISHVEEVEYQCSLFVNRPHLRDTDQPTQESILHGYQADTTSRTVQERFLLVQEQNSPQDIAKICNGIEDTVMQSECYFVAADSFHSRRGTQAFKDMIQLCFASGPFVEYCLSHIPQRMTVPTFQQKQRWKEWDERFAWMQSQSDHELRIFGERLMTQMAFRVVQEMSVFCWDSIHEGTNIESSLQDALVFFQFAEQKEKRRFFDALKSWDEMFFSSCSTNIQRDTPRRIQLPRPVPTKGRSTTFLQGHRRPTSHDVDEDRALFLVESGYYLDDQFVLYDALQHSSDVVKDRAQILKEASKR